MIKLRPSIEIAAHCFPAHVAGAEIGVLGGTNAVSMLTNFPQLETLHLIDPYGGITDKDPKFVNDFKPRFTAYGDRIVWHIKTSLEASLEIPDCSLDFVYIDGSHRYSFVADDIRAWWPKLKPAGILCGHDYFTHGSVKKVVDDWARANNHWVFTTNPDWWVFKE